MRKLGIMLVLLFGMLGFVPGAVLHAQQAGSGEITVQAIPGPTIAQKMTERMKTSWPWYVSRGSGMVAAVALVLLMISGVGQITGFTFRLLAPLTAWASHRALGIVFGVAVLLHMFSLLFDHFIKFNLLQLFVPWLSTYRPVTIFSISFGSLYVALGVLAFYLTVFVVVTSLVWVEKKPYIWKIIHIASYLLLAFVFIHALYLGTDLADGILRVIWIILGVIVAAVSLQRLWRAGTV